MPCVRREVEFSDAIKRGWPMAGPSCYRQSAGKCRQRVSRKLWRFAEIADSIKGRWRGRYPCGPRARGLPVGVARCQLGQVARIGDPGQSGKATSRSRKCLIATFAYAVGSASLSAHRIRWRIRSARDRPVRSTRRDNASAVTWSSSIAASVSAVLARRWRMYAARLDCLACVMAWRPVLRLAEQWIVHAHRLR